MKEYKIVKAEGVLLEGNEESHAMGSITQLDPEADQTKALLADGSIVEVDAVRDENGVPSETGVVGQGPFSVSITWKHGTTDEEQEAALDFVKMVTKSVNEDAADVPACINVITVKRL